MTDQTKDEIRMVQEINKAKTYEHKKSENQKLPRFFFLVREQEPIFSLVFLPFFSHYFCTVYCEPRHHYAAAN